MKLIHSDTSMTEVQCTGCNQNLLYGSQDIGKSSLRPFSKVALKMS